MLTGIAAAIAQNVILGWVWRRVQELVSHAVWIVPLFLALPAQHQEMILGIFQGKGGGYTISAYIGLLGFLWTQWQSYRATTQPHLVTVDAKKITLPAKGQTGASVTREAESVAKTAPAPKTLWERLTSR
jgi:hypothetical protein